LFVQPFREITERLGRFSKLGVLLSQVFDRFLTFRQGVFFWFAGSVITHWPSSSARNATSIAKLRPPQQTKADAASTNLKLP
jgi:hypothetical protein